MLRPIDQYFLRQEEPVKSCMEFLRELILKMDPHIEETWSYGMPFFTFNGKRCFYLWIDHKLNQPYIGFVDGKILKEPDLIGGNRKRMKIFMVDPTKNIPVGRIRKLLQAAIQIYK